MVFPTNSGPLNPGPLETAIASRISKDKSFFSNSFLISGTNIEM